MRLTDERLANRGAELLVGSKVTRNQNSGQSSLFTSKLSDSIFLNVFLRKAKRWQVYT